MSEADGANGPTSLERAAWIDGLCDRYEDALRAGYRPAVEEFLRAASIDPAAASPDLLAELAKLDAAYPDGTASQPGPARAETLPSPDTLPPDAPSIPGYQIVEVLGEGGMGVVYKAWQLNAPRLVALKVVRAGPHASPTELARFKVEVAAISRLQHPHVVQVFEVDEHAGLPFFSMELCPGSLAQRLGGNPMPPIKAAELVEKLTLGVQAAHAEKVIHRDLKPANVLLAADGTPKVTDFGLAKLTDVADASTRTDVVMGTPSYMAPELASGRAKEAGPTADVYALGAVLYECLTGRPPFKGASVVDTLVQVKTQEPVTVRDLVPGVHHDLEAVCHKCLEKEPARRYASAADLAADLRAFLEHRPTKARPVGSLGKLRRWVGRNRGLSGALGAVAAALLLGIGVSTGFGLWAIDEAGKAKTAADNATKSAAAERDARHEAQRLLAQASLDKGVAHFDAGDYGLGLLHLTHALTVAPDSPEANDEARRVFGVYWRYGKPPFARLAQQFRLSDGKKLIPGGGREPLAFNPDGTRLVLPGVGRVSMHDLTEGGKVLAFFGAGDLPTAARFSPDGNRLLVEVYESSKEKTRNEHKDLLQLDKDFLERDRRDVWRIDTRQRVASDKPGWLFPPPISPDCRRRTGLVDGKLTHSVVLDVESGKPLAKFLTGRISIAISFSSDGRKILAQALPVGLVVDGQAATAGTEPGRGLWSAHVIDAETGREIVRLDATGVDLFFDSHDLTFSPDGRWIAASGPKARVWAAETGEVVTQLPSFNSRSGASDFVDFSPDSTRVVVGSGERLAIVETVTGKVFAVLHRKSGTFSHVAFGPDGRRLLTVGSDGLGQLWEAGTGELLRSFSAEVPGRIVLSPNGRHLATVSGSVVRIWESDNAIPMAATQTSRIPWRLSQGSKQWAHPDGDVLSISDDRGQSKKTTLIDSKGFKSPTFSPDGARVIATYGSIVSVWNISNGQKVSEFSVLEGNAAGQAVFGPDGVRVVTIGDETARPRVWDVSTGKPVSPPLPHPGRVTFALFSPDGRRVATFGGSPLSARLWDARTGRPLSPLLHHVFPIVGPSRPSEWGPEFIADFSSDGNRLYTSPHREQSKVQEWDIGPDERPTADLVALAQLLSGHRIDEGGAVVPLTADELMRLWDDLRAKYPEEFTVTPAQTRAWRQREIRDCIREGNPAAAQFHHWAQINDALQAGGK